MRRDEDAGRGIRADQVRRLVFLVGHPTQALQSHIEIWRLCKNALKAEACLFLVEWDLFLLQNFLAQEKKKKLDRRQFKRKEATPTLKFSPSSKDFCLSNILPPFLPLCRFLIFTLSHLPVTGSGTFSWLTYQLAAWDEKESAIRRSSQCGSDMVPFVRDELQHVGVGIWPSQVVKEEWRVKNIKKRRRESWPACIT